MAYRDIAGNAPFCAFLVNIPTLGGSLGVIKVTVGRRGAGSVEVTEDLVLCDQVAVVVN